MLTAQKGVHVVVAFAVQPSLYFSKRATLELGPTLNLTMLIPAKQRNLMAPRVLGSGSCSLRQVTGIRVTTGFI